MYKRKPRILFFASTSQLAEQAAAILLQEGAAWADAQCQYGDPLSIPDEQLAWADLLVILDQQMPTPAIDLPVHIQVRHWPVMAEEGDAQTEVRRRIHGMLGGIRMLAASDEL